MQCLPKDQTIELRLPACGRISWPASKLVSGHCYMEVNQSKREADPLPTNSPAAHLHIFTLSHTDFLFLSLQIFYGTLNYYVHAEINPIRHCTTCVCVWVSASNQPTTSLVTPSKFTLILSFLPRFGLLNGLLSRVIPKVIFLLIRPIAPTRCIPTATHIPPNARHLILSL